MKTITEHYTMKYLFIITALMLLASCSNSTTQTQQDAKVQTQQEISTFSDELPESTKTLETTETSVEENISNDDVIESEIQEGENETTLPEVSKSAPAESRVVELSTTYNNPKMKVEMDIDITLSAEGKIEAISVTSSNYQ